MLRTKTVDAIFAATTTGRFAASEEVVPDAPYLWWYRRDRTGCPASAFRRAIGSTLCWCRPLTELTGTESLFFEKDRLSPRRGTNIWGVGVWTETNPRAEGPGQVSYFCLE